MAHGRQFFFLGSCREEGILEENPFGRMISSTRRFGVQATVVKLDGMDKEMTNTIVSNLLCLSPRLTRPLSDLIYHKTKGIPLFFSRLMISLCKDGLVRLSLSRRRWVWDEEKIQARKLPNDVATFLTSTIDILPNEVQNALSLLACFGACSDSSLLGELEKLLGMPIIEPLEVAVAEGLLENANSSYRFVHDRLQEVAYNMIRPEDRCVHHFKYGVNLASLSIQLDSDDILFIAVSQINRGGPEFVKDSDQAVLIADLNLKAGKKAMEMSDFSSAYSLFDNGISFLRKRHWQEHYDLSYQLFESASDCALVIGDIQSLQLLSAQILKYAKSYEEKLPPLYNIVSALAYDTQLIPESINNCLSVLSELGQELPESMSESDIKSYVEQTKVLLQGYTDQDLIEYRRMEEQSKIMTMKFLARLELSFQMTKPASQPIVTMKMVQLSIACGMSPLSPIGFTYFGQLLARLGNIQEGYRYVVVGRKMLERIRSMENSTEMSGEGEVIAQGNQIRCFVDPVQTAVEFHLDGQTAAMASGDTHGALLNSVSSATVHFFSIQTAATSTLYLSHIFHFISPAVLLA